MKNYWLEKIAKRGGSLEKSEVCKWDFQTALGDTIREKYEKLYVKVLSVENVSMASQRRWNRVEFLSSPGQSIVFKDENADCGAWGKLVERPDCGVPLPQASAHKDEPKEDVLPPWNTNSDLSGYDLNELPPWHTENYNGWECDL